MGSNSTFSLYSYLSRAPGIFVRNRPYIVDGNRSLTDAIMLDNLELIVQFSHRIFIVLGICIFFKTGSPLGALKSLLGLALIIFNGFCFSVILSILASRFKDLHEAVTPLNSMFFLATPIIWMPGPGIGQGKGAILSAYMNFNPFYHFLEIFRAPLLSKPISDITIIFVGVTTILGLIFCSILYAKTRTILPYWLN